MVKVNGANPFNDFPHPALTFRLLLFPIRKTFHRPIGSNIIADKTDLSMRPFMLWHFMGNCDKNI